MPVKAQLVLALVVAAGAGGGADRGAIAGFILGLMYDLSSNTPLGVTALSYGFAGLLAGYVQTITPDPQWWLASIFAGVGAGVGELSIPFVEAVTGKKVAEVPADQKSQMLDQLINRTGLVGR